MFLNKMALILYFSLLICGFFQITCAIKNSLNFPINDIQFENEITLHLKEATKLSEPFIEQLGLKDVLKTMEVVNDFIKQDRQEFERLSEKTKNEINANLETVFDEEDLLKLKMRYKENLLRAETLARYLFFIPQIVTATKVWAELSQADNLIKQSNEFILKLNTSLTQILENAEKIHLKLQKFTVPLSNEANFKAEMIRLNSINHEIQILEIRFVKTKENLDSLQLNVDGKVQTLSDLKADLGTGITYSTFNAISSGSTLYALGNSWALAHPIGAGVLGANAVINTVMGIFQAYEYKLSTARIAELSRILQQLKSLDPLTLEIDCTIQNVKAHVEFHWAQFMGEMDVLLAPVDCNKNSVVAKDEL